MPPVFYWNLWKATSYPSYVSYLACVVWNFYGLMGWPMPDPHWAYLVCMGYRGKKFVSLDDPL